MGGVGAHWKCFLGSCDVTQMGDCVTRENERTQGKRDGLDLPDLWGKSREVCFTDLWINRHEAQRSEERCVYYQLCSKVQISAGLTRHQVKEV